MVTIKSAILKCIIQWHLHSQCCTTITSIQFQNISSSPKKTPYTAIKQSLPIPLFPASGNNQSALCFYGFIYYGYFIFKKIIQYVAFCARLLSRRILFFKFICVTACTITSFLFMDEYYSIVQIDHILLYLFIHLSCFQLSAIVNKLLNF